MKCVRLQLRKPDNGGLTKTTALLFGACLWVCVWVLLFLLFFRASRETSASN